MNDEIKNILTNLQTNITGLANEQVNLNREKYGTNTLGNQKKESFFHKFLMQFKNLMIIILLLSSFISGIIAIISKTYSDLFESALILLIVIVNALVGTLQERKAENTLALLQQQASTHAKVIRNKKLISINIDDVVVGDIVELKTGDFVPADIRLINTNNFSCDESSLTGESKKVDKDALAKIKGNSLLHERLNMCYKGTTVSSGNATGVVMSVGKSTEIGKIAKLIDNNLKQKTPLEKNIDKIGKFITIGVSAIVVVVFLVQIVFSNKINFGDAFMTAIALAVAAIPESLPAVITIIMALGVQKLARHGAIVKTLSSVETLGCCTCICSDKTGTLTQNKMQVVHVYIDNKINSSFSEINKSSQTHLINAISLCNNAKLDAEHKIIGDATEKALFMYCKDNNVNIDRIRQLNQRIFEDPFDSIKKSMTTVNILENGEKRAYIKGAFDYLIEKCTSYILNGETLNITNNVREKIKKAHDTLTKNTERVLLIAEANVTNTSSLQPNNFTFIGLIGIMDPPRPEVHNAIKKCHKAGLKTIMITGDHKETALAIALSLGIATSSQNVISGKELDLLSDKDFKKVIHKYSVFARVSPEHKTRIVKALKSQGEIVAMTGDGVNDAPSIKSADIGTCMGITGTDVTKSVSDLIITDDNFATIVVAISLGRTIYNNIQKTLQFLISTNAVEVIGLFVVSIMMRDSVFLLPSQILFINLITDSLPAFALGIESPEKDIMKKPPRPTQETIFSGEIGTAIIYQAFIQSLVVLILFVCSYHAYGNAVATTMTFIAICLMQILHAVNCKTNHSLFTINIFNNKFFNFSFILLFVLILLVALIPPLQTAFSIVSLNSTQWLIVALSSISIIPLVELCKLIFKHKRTAT